MRLAKSSSMYLFMPSTTLTTVIRNMTPMITPTTAKKLFSFCARIWPRASITPSLIYTCRTPCGDQLAAGQRHACGRRPMCAVEHVTRDDAVAPRDHPAGVLGDIMLMGNQQDGLSLRVQLAE